MSRASVGFEDWCQRVAKETLLPFLAMAGGMGKRFAAINSLVKARHAGGTEAVLTWLEEKGFVEWDKETNVVYLKGDGDASVLLHGGRMQANGEGEEGKEGDSDNATSEG